MGLTQSDIYLYTPSLFVSFATLFQQESITCGVEYSAL